MRSFLVGLREFLASKKPKFGETIRSTNTLTEEAESILKEALKEFKEEFAG